MLYHLLYPLAGKFTLFNVLRYPSFRILAAGFTALGLGLLLGPLFIERMRVIQYGASNVREDTPDSHRKKSGTPSMGGALILFCLSVSTLLFANLRNRYVWTVLVVTLAFGAIGFWDDYLKLSKRNSKGLAGKKKLLWQTLVLLAVYYLFLSDLHFHFESVFPWLRVGSYQDLHLSLPFVPLRWFAPSLGWLYLPFMIFVILATSHGVNLTDGLDGLAIGCTVIAAGALTVLTYVSGHAQFSAYLELQRIPQVGEVTIFCGALVGASIGFLWYNAHPAEIFMGDVGSLALGGAIGTVAVIIKQELLLPFIGGIFVIEALSVILQVGSYKLRKKRIFKMAPIHHHFELLGWSESKVIVRFWIASLVFALFALTTLKLR